MKARTKAPIIIVGTFIAGLVVGILVTNYVVNDRIERMRDLRSRTGYSEAVLNVLQPNSPEQREQIELILQQTHDGMNRLRKEWSRGFYAEGDSMRARLQHVLTVEQLAALDAWFHRHQPRSRPPEDGRRRRDDREGRGDNTDGRGDDKDGRRGENGGDNGRGSGNRDADRSDDRGGDDSSNGNDSAKRDGSLNEDNSRGKRRSHDRQDSFNHNRPLEDYRNRRR